MKSFLEQLADEVHPTSSSKDITVTECNYEEIVYQAVSWIKSRKVIIYLSTLPMNYALLTNLGDSFHLKQLFKVIENVTQ